MMKTKLVSVGMLLVFASFGLTACASYSDSAEGTTVEDNYDSYTPDEKAQIYNDENSVIKVGDNGVTTITVTLNNGTKVECVEYTTLVCFPELSEPR